jgi:hypothetical protein|tara:strand:+ start:2207 stop:2368 length:162 start_codon:yes stop_codon:yes gene_type:complete
MYKLIKENNNIVNILNLKQQLWIPLDPANSDYQEYLTWLAEGNEPEPADEPGE